MNKSNDSEAYDKILKATSLFGGVQVINIFVTIIRTKIIALLLGPLGIGINGLLISTLGFIERITNFGLGSSAIRNVAAANSSGDKTRVAKVVLIFRKLVWFTGLLGSIITVILSPVLSQITFGNKDYTLAFIWISITLLFNQISAGQAVVLRGMRKLKYLAQSSLSGSTLGLMISTPIYYFFKINGIVPSIILMSLASLLRTWYYSRKVKFEKVTVNKTEILTEGKDMLKLGFMIGLSGLISLFASYLLRIYISNTGGIEQVGLYTAGFAFINTYVSLISSAMGTDYYPRLSAVAHDNNRSRVMINQQAEVTLLILGPIITTFIIYIHLIIIIFYSKQFIPVDEMLNYGAIGTFFKATSWAIAFIILAKGNSQLFFVNELSGNIYMLCFNIIGYKFLGLTGLGISFMVGYFVYHVQVWLISKHKFEFYFNNEAYKIFLVQFLFSGVSIFLVKFIGGITSYIIGTLIILIASTHSFIEINKRISVSSFLKKLLKKEK
jgi:O-antigen/teichoic acid export membrane protein